MKKVMFIALCSISSLHGVARHNEYLKELYKNVNSYCIDHREIKKIEDGGGNATYGEITDEAVDTIIDTLNITPQDIFFDLGAGAGRMAVKIYLDSPVKKSVGVELSETRHKQAQDIKQELKKQGKLQAGRILEFKEGNILDADIHDATIVHMCSTCFSDDFMRKLTDKLAQLKSGLRVLTLRKLPDHKDFVLKETFCLPMTWSKNVTVYLYELQKESMKKPEKGKKNPANA